jgi:hypothetical protein
MSDNAPHDNAPPVTIEPEGPIVLTAIKNDTGRPAKLTPEVATKICAMIRAGAYSHVAAQAAGISMQTFSRWLTLAEEEGQHTAYREFRIAVMVARAQARATAEIQVRKDKPEIWLRRGPGRERPGDPGWSATDKVEVSGPGGGPMRVEHEVDLKKLSDEEFKAYRALLQKARAASAKPSEETIDVTPKR